MEFCLSLSSSDNDIFFTTFVQVLDTIFILKESCSYVRRTRVVLNRDHVYTYELLVCNYFVDDFLYNHTSFEPRCCLSGQLFLCIVNNLEANYEFFKLKWNA